MCITHKLPACKRDRITDLLASNPEAGSVKTFTAFIENFPVDITDATVFMTDSRNIIMDWTEGLEIEFLKNMYVKVSTDFIDSSRWEIADDRLKTLLKNKGLVTAGGYA